MKCDTLKGCYGASFAKRTGVRNRKLIYDVVVLSNLISVYYFHFIRYYCIQITYIYLYS